VSGEMDWLHRLSVAARVRFPVSADEGTATEASAALQCLDSGIETSTWDPIA
jgi:hypothetical protein